MHNIHRPSLHYCLICVLTRGIWCNNAVQLSFHLYLYPDSVLEGDVQVYVLVNNAGGAMAVNKW
jgi:hypothetical protein